MNAQNILPADVFLVHWLGHRALTRRLIEAFPEDQLFTFTPAPPMRSFGAMAWEIHGQTGYNVSGLVNDQWGEPQWDALPSQSKTDLLQAWDSLSARLERELPGVPPTRYAETKKLTWGPMLAYTAVIGSLDNEIHHRGQGMVYLRLLGIKPPDFWER